MYLRLTEQQNNFKILFEQNDRRESSQNHIYFNVTCKTDIYSAS